MLQKLQQMLVAQQQQQQQRQLHELLLQLLAVHKLATNDNISPQLNIGQQESPLHIKRSGMCVCCMEITSVCYIAKTSSQRHNSACM